MTAPVPQEELPILEKVINIRNRLTVLKKDRGDYIKASDVNSLYQATIKQVTKLNDVREEKTPSSNRLDTTLADVFNLLSLFFLTIGKTKEAPATYSQLASMRVSLSDLFPGRSFASCPKLHRAASIGFHLPTLCPSESPLKPRAASAEAHAEPWNVIARTVIADYFSPFQQILDHMNESAIYNEADLAPFHRRLTELRNIIKHDADSGKHPEAMTKLLERQLGECESILRSLQDSLAVLSVELIPIHEKLVNIRRKLVALAAKEGPQKAELKPLQEELRKIDSKRVDGKFLGPGGMIPASQAICSSLLEECFDIVQEIRAQEESKNVASSLKPIYDRLRELRIELEGLALTHRWSLRETDLWNYSLSLQEIDKMRIDGKFMDSEGNQPAGQYVGYPFFFSFEQRKAQSTYASEPVSEELMPIANKLSTVKKCLNEVLKYGGPFSPRDLYPYQLALYQIDSMRKDGKFIGIDGTVPEGQGIVMAHLSECHELLEMLKQSMDEHDDEDTEEDDMDTAELVSGASSDDDD
ncbi:hypothetical protein EW146_g1894 [Bondarzewia mesenterica]|uniref:Uncharacterized protein n=1 Tax=Bondarzewia mesenterica TaxID=1095465 RepID=A0A4S4M4P3_9AGAM|nr:hypothetical protein EW146_g1894 [Bondarzewia mesenterica]